MTLVLDRRERLLSQSLDGYPHTLENLAVGDCLCRYGDGSVWIAERKTISDLANSIKSNRWAEQTSRLYQSGYERIFFLIEGDLKEDVGLPYNNLWAACLNAELRKNSHCIRTLDVKETAVVVRQLVQKGMHSPGIPTGLPPPKALTKRKRDADKKVIFVRQLMVIPSISEHVATKLFAHFGTLPSLQKALHEKTFPKIRLDDRHALGKGRVNKLATYLL